MANGTSKAALRRIVQITMVLALMAGTAVAAPTAGAQDVGPPQPFAPGDPHATIRAANEAARTLWANEEPAAYSYGYRLNCFCPVNNLITVTIIDGVVNSAVNETGTPISNAIRIEEMFDRIEDAADAPVDGLAAEFNDTYGYPENFAVDVSVMIADEEYSLTMVSFRDFNEDAEVIVEPALSCLNSDGRVDLNLDSQSPADGPIDYVLTVGTVERTIALLSGSPEVETVTGRPDGPLLIQLADTNGDVLWTATVIIDCDPPVPEIAFADSCLAHNGRVDVFITNPPGPGFVGPFPPPIIDDRYTVTFGSLAPRDLLVAQGEDTRRVTTTGRPDEPIEVIVEKNTIEIARTTIDVDCDPIPSEVRIEVSCLAGNGRIDVYLFNNLADIGADFDVLIGNLDRRALVDPEEIERVTVTGRPNGAILVSVDKFGVPLYEEVVSVSCD